MPGKESTFQAPNAVPNKHMAGAVATADIHLGLGQVGLYMIILNTALAYHLSILSILLNSKKLRILKTTENHYAVEEVSSAGLMTCDTSNTLLTFLEHL